jgi:hypothetical protein
LTTSRNWSFPFLFLFPWLVYSACHIHQSFQYQLLGCWWRSNWKTRLVRQTRIDSLVRTGNGRHLQTETIPIAYSLCLSLANRVPSRTRFFGRPTYMDGGSSKYMHDRFRHWRLLHKQLSTEKLDGLFIVSTGKLNYRNQLRAFCVLYLYILLWERLRGSTSTSAVVLLCGSNYWKNYSIVQGVFRCKKKVWNLATVAFSFVFGN